MNLPSNNPLFQVEASRGKRSPRALRGLFCQSELNGFPHTDVAGLGEPHIITRHKNESLQYLGILMTIPEYPWTDGNVGASENISTQQSPHLARRARGVARAFGTAMRAQRRGCRGGCRLRELRASSRRHPQTKKRRPWFPGLEPANL